MQIYLDKQLLFFRGRRDS